jgi:hypothetical protein
MSKSIALLFLCVAMAAPAAAQVLTAASLLPGADSFKLDTGLLTLFATPNRLLEVTVTEIAPGAKSRVRITFRDASDRALSTDEGVLERGQPVVHALPIDIVERRVKVRASILITPLTGSGTPVVVVEDIDPLALTIEPRVMCAMSLPSGRIDPVLPMCGEVVPSVILAP